jgi:hypothetical protein
MRAEDAPSRLGWRMFWTGFVVRVLFITLTHSYRFMPIMDHFQFGWEMGRIARSLATGHGYSSPFLGESGPTAWCPPLYPLLLAGVFKLFGVYTQLSGWVILTINSVFSAATAPLVYEIARRCFADGTGTRATRQGIAVWSGWLWALYPAAMQYAVRWVWDIALTAFLFTWILVLALRVRGIGEQDPGARRHQTLGRWLAFGSLWGLVALTNSALLTFLPTCGIWMILPMLSSRTGFLLAARNALLAAVCCAAFVLPWIVRNEIAFHAFVPMRANFGAELYEAALPWNEGFPWAGTISPAGGDDFPLYKSLGELEYSKRQELRAKAIIDEDPGLFYGFVAKRAYFFWFGVPHPIETDRHGNPLAKSVMVEATREIDFEFISLAAFLGLALALRNRIAGAWLFAWAIVLFPPIYYLVTVQGRFRHPLEPFLLILIVYLFQSAEPRWQSTGRVIGRRRYGPLE